MNQNYEAMYHDMFKRLNTRKKFTIYKVEGEKVIVQEDQEICGEKEPKRHEFNNAKELDEFIYQENKAERDIENQLSGDDMPYR